MTKRLRCITPKCMNYAEEDYGLCGTCTEKRFEGVWYRRIPAKQPQSKTDGYMGDTVEI